MESLVCGGKTLTIRNTCDQTPVLWRRLLVFLHGFFALPQAHQQAVKASDQLVNLVMLGERQGRRQLIQIRLTGQGLGGDQQR